MCMLHDPQVPSLVSAIGIPSTFGLNEEERTSLAGNIFFQELEAWKYFSYMSLKRWYSDILLQKSLQDEEYKSARK